MTYSTESCNQFSGDVVLQIQYECLLKQYHLMLDILPFFYTTDWWNISFSTVVLSGKFAKCAGKIRTKLLSWNNHSIILLLLYLKLWKEDLRHVQHRMHYGFGGALYACRILITLSSHFLLLHCHIHCHIVQCFVEIEENSPCMSCLCGILAACRFSIDLLVILKRNLSQAIFLYILKHNAIE